MLVILWLQCSAARSPRGGVAGGDLARVLLPTAPGQHWVAGESEMALPAPVPFPSIAVRSWGRRVGARARHAAARRAAVTRQVAAPRAAFAAALALSTNPVGATDRNARGVSCQRATSWQGAGCVHGRGLGCRLHGRAAPRRAPQWAAGHHGSYLAYVRVIVILQPRRPVAPHRSRLYPLPTRREPPASSPSAMGGECDREAATGIKYAIRAVRVS